MIKVIATKLEGSLRTIILTEDQSRSLRKHFDAFSYDGTPGARCHSPPYQIETHVDDVVLYCASICWRCFNVWFTEPRNKGLRGFDCRAPAATALKRVLDALFRKTKVPPPGSSRRRAEKGYPVFFYKRTAIGVLKGDRPFGPGIYRYGDLWRGVEGKLRGLLETKGPQWCHYVEDKVRRRFLVLELPGYYTMKVGEVKESKKL